MTVQVNVKEPWYLHREFGNDVGQKPGTPAVTWLDTAKEAATASLPLLSLLPISFPLTLAAGAARTVTYGTQLLDSLQKGEADKTSTNALHATVAAGALACTVFAHPLGMLLTTGQDLAIEASRLLQNMQAGETQASLENCLHIANNALYLALMVKGGLGLTIASLSVQIINSVYHSLAEFRQGNNFQGAAHLLMALFRTRQLNIQVDRVIHPVQAEGKSYIRRDYIKGGNYDDGIVYIPGKYYIAFLPAWDRAEYGNRWYIEKSDEARFLKEGWKAGDQIVIQQMGEYCFRAYNETRNSYVQCSQFRFW